jgi:hypothetical protein
MKKSQLKSTLKPLIKECIKEILFEEGVLSGIISEVVRGTQPLEQPQTPMFKVEQKQTSIDPEGQKRILEQKWEQERERKRKLLDATGFKGVDLFEGTVPLNKGGDPTGTGTSSTQGSLTGIAPDDAGIDISGIMAVGNGEKWKNLI